MSTRTKSVDAGLLQQLSDRISAPLPSKTRFLHELSGDVRALTRSLMENGVPADEAHQRALEALVPDAETVRRLEHLHASWYRRLTIQWSGARLRRAERFGLAGAFFVILAIQTGAMLRADFARYVTPFLWLVMAAGALVVLALAWKAFELWVKRDHSRPRSGLRGLLTLSCLPIAVAVCGVWFDLIVLANRLEVQPELQRELVLRSLIQDAAMLSIAILFALFGALGWLLFTQWVAIHEEAHRRALDSTTFPEV